uniref:Uncharacterized protein n=1 Tax=Daphnia magna TaxID=35525 RepID=A0A0P5UA27_9CRUS
MTRNFVVWLFARLAVCCLDGEKQTICRWVKTLRSPSVSVPLISSRFRGQVRLCTIGRGLSESKLDYDKSLS